MVGPGITARELTATRNKEKVALVAPLYLSPAPYTTGQLCFRVQKIHWPETRPRCSVGSHGHALQEIQSW